MCWCNPNLRTPHCGKTTCVPPAAMSVDTPNPAWRCPDCGNGADKNHRGCWAQRLRRMMPQQVTSEDLDDLATAIERLQGENRTLAGILRDCDGVLETIEPDDSEEGHNLRDLRMAIDFALDPNKRKEGMLL